MFSVGKMAGLVKNFNFEIFSDTMNVTNVKAGLMVLFIELYLFIPLSVTSIIFQGHSNVEQFKNIFF